MYTKRFLVNGLIFLLSFSIISCNDDGDTTSPQGSGFFTLDGVRYDLGQGFIEDYGVNDDGQSADLDVTLLSPTFNINFEAQTATGTGNSLYFDLNSPSLNGLSAGTYVFDTSVPRKALQMIDGDVLLGLDFAAETFEQEFLVTAGQVVVTRTDNTFTLSFTLTLDNGQELIGNYTGLLTEVVL